MEKYLSYNKIGNLISFSSTPQITPSHPPRYNNLPFAMKHNLRDFYIVVQASQIKKSAYSQTEATEGTHWQFSGCPPLGPKCPSLQAHIDFGSFIMPHSNQKLNGTTRAHPGSTIYPVSPPHCSSTNPNLSCATQDLHGVKPPPWSVPKT